VFDVVLLLINGHVCNILLNELFMIFYGSWLRGLEIKWSGKQGSELNGSANGFNGQSGSW